MHDSLTIALLQAREAAMSYFRPIVKRHNLTEQQWRIVRVLAEHPSMDFHDLAFRTCILRPSLTGILTRMERDGLIRRERDPADQRRTVVEATAKGLKLVEKLSRTIEAHYAWVESQLGKPKLNQLYALLDELIALEQPADRAEATEPETDA